jgi:hypothetical protein
LRGTNFAIADCDHGLRDQIQLNKRNWVSGSRENISWSYISHKSISYT